jgi:predicted transposase YdaD
MNYVYVKGKMSPIIEKNLKEAIKTKGKGIMKHAIELMLEERDKDVLERGLLKEKERMARAMLDRGDDKEEVARITGLTIDDILRLM